MENVIVKSPCNLIRFSNRHTCWNAPWPLFSPTLLKCIQVKKQKGKGFLLVIPLVFFMTTSYWILSRASFLFLILLLADRCKGVVSTEFRSYIRAIQSFVFFISFSFSNNRARMCSVAGLCRRIFGNLGECMRLSRRSLPTWTGWSTSPRVDASWLPCALISFVFYSFAYIELLVRKQQKKKRVRRESLFCFFCPTKYKDTNTDHKRHSGQHGAATSSSVEWAKKHLPWPRERERSREFFLSFESSSLHQIYSNRKEI